MTDLFSEDMNGVEVLLISGHPEADQKYLADFINAGGNPRILSKPLSTDEMSGAVETVLKGSEL